MKTLYLTLLLILIPTMSYGYWLPTESQSFILDIAKTKGNDIGWPETIQAFQIVESSAGVNKYGPPAKDFADRYFGSTQMKISTARYVMEHIMKLDNTYSDYEIMVRLVTNDIWAIELCAAYFEYLLHKFRNSPDPWKYAVLAYNRGPGTVRKHGLNKDPHKYVDNMINTIKTLVRPYNKIDRIIYPTRTKHVPESVQSVVKKYTNIY